MEDFRSVGRRLSNWGRWGSSDQSGTLNFLTSQCVAAAGQLIRTGRTFRLGGSLSADPAGAHGRVRFDPIHLLSADPGETVRSDGAAFADDLVIMPLQSGAHWDGLAHCWYDGLMYNGIPASAITPDGCATELGLDRLINPVVGRGVLLDVAALRGVEQLPLGTVIGPDDLDCALARQNVEVRSGDIILVRTGSNITNRRRRQKAVGRDPGRRLWPEPGLSQMCCEWLHERQVAALASDNYAVEVLPPEDRGAILPVHCILIRDMGMLIGERFDLSTLAADCARDGVWEFFFAAQPLNLPNSLGSPLNPLAIK